MGVVRKLKILTILFRDESFICMERTVFKIAVIIFVLFSSQVQSLPLNEIYNTKWIAQKSLKYGMLGSLCLAQSITGLSEGYHFNNNSGYIVTRNNYHVYETFRRGSWIATGWFGYANFRDADLTWFNKIRRIIGSACIARNCFEWFYKWQRYNNPFDYTEAHNKHAMVYFKFRKGHLVDAYIGTGPVDGPLFDAAFLLTGLLLFK